MYSFINFMQSRNNYIFACEVNGSILGPGLIRHMSVQPFFFSKCFACLVGPNKKICVYTPKQLGRIGRDFFFFFFF